MVFDIVPGGERGCAAASNARRQIGEAATAGGDLVELA
jgi:hypothetical protein